MSIAFSRKYAAGLMAGGLLVMLFGLWTLPGPHQHWLMGH